jgi:uncharacterized protein YjbI with pentapeptide repeats
MSLSCLHFLKKPATYIIASIAIIVIALISFYPNIVEFLFPDGADTTNSPNFEIMKFSAYIIGGILLVWQIYLTNLRTKAAESTAKASHKNLMILEKGQVQERFKNAITHLGSENEAVNLGAVYTLHHIAKDCSELRKSVFDILCSYIRETTSKQTYQDLGKTSIKIQSILNLLFIDKDERSIYMDFKANLQDAWLVKSHLSDAIILQAQMKGVNLSTANCSRINLKGSDLSGANLNKINLKFANLQMAILDRTNLQQANLEYSIVNKAKIRRSNLHLATLDRSHFLDADFALSGLQGITCKEARLQGANFYLCDLEVSKFCNANLAGARFRRCSLQGSDFDNAKLQGVVFFKNLIEGASFIEANFEGAFENSTILYSSFKQRIEHVSLAQLNIDPSVFVGGEFTEKMVLGTISCFEAMDPSVSNRLKVLLEKKQRVKTISSDSKFGVLSNDKAKAIVEEYEQDSKVENLVEEEI